METIYALVPAMILLALVSVLVFFWAARSGQYDDMEGPAHRILDDDDDPRLPENTHQNRHQQEQPKRSEDRQFDADKRSS